MAFPSEIQQQVYDLLSRSSNLAIVPAEPVEQPVALGQQVLTLAPGQRVTAEVMGQPQAGKIPVQIGNQQLQLDLQMTVRQGQNLELTFVGNDPRPTFALARPGVTAPPVSLTDASRLLSLLVGNEQFIDPRQRSSLQSISDLLRQASSSTNALAGFLDDFLTYRADGRSVVMPPGGLLDRPGQSVGDELRQPPGQGAGQTVKTTVFEDAASKLLMNLAQRSRLTLVDVVNHPLAPLPLQPGEEANALVQGRLPGGRVLVQLAGESLELQLAKPVVQGEILRLALVTQQPKLVFALLGQPVRDQPGLVSDAARWMSAMVGKEEGQTEVQRMVLGRLQQVIDNLPPGSSALAAIMDDAMLYGASAALSARSLQNRSAPVEGKADEGIMKLLQALMHGSRLALVEPQVSSEAVKAFAPGQQLKGEVLQSLGGGRFLAQVGGQAFEVLLPKGMRPGDRLNLFFVGDDPPTFLLVRYGKGGDALVSQTGRWISSLLGMQNQTAPLAEGLGILRTLLQNAPSDPAQLEQVLKQGLKESGLFYESHLARWFSGQYPLERLLQEPQGRLSPQQGGETAARQTGAQQPVPEGSDPRTLPMVKEQLAALQTGQLLFQGELFPGQQMEWRIREREGRGRQGEQEQGQSWETSLALHLPRLGQLQAVLNLQENRLDLQITTDDPATAPLLEGEAAGLQEQLLAAGLEPGTFKVQHGS